MIKNEFKGFGRGWEREEIVRIRKALEKLNLSGFKTKLVVDYYETDGLNNTFKLKHKLVGTEENIEVVLGGVTLIPYEEYTYFNGYINIKGEIIPQGYKLFIKYLAEVVEEITDTDLALKIKEFTGVGLNEVITLQNIKVIGQINEKIIDEKVNEENINENNSDIVLEDYRYGKIVKARITNGNEVAFLDANDNIIDTTLAGFDKIDVGAYFEIYGEKYSITEKNDNDLKFYNHNYLPDGDYNCEFISGLIANENAVTMNAGEGSEVPSGVVTHYNFENNIEDQVGSNDLSANGNSPSYVDGISGKCVYFDGSYDLIDGTSGDFDLEYTDPFTMSIAFKTTLSGEIRALFGKTEIYDTTYGFSLFINADGQIYYSSKGKDNGGEIKKHTNNAFNDGNWHTVTLVSAGTGTGDGIKIYVDGVEQQCTYLVNISFTNTLKNDRPFSIGGYDQQTSNRYFKGYLDEFRFWKRVLTDDEIQTVHDIIINNLQNLPYFYGKYTALHLNSSKYLNAVWEKIEKFLATDNDISEIYYAISFDSNRTFKVRKNNQWKAIVTNKPEIHGVSGDNSYYYLSGNTWTKADVNNADYALSKAVEDDDNKFTKTELNILDEDEICNNGGFYNSFKTLFSFAVIMKASDKDNLPESQRFKIWYSINYIKEANEKYDVYYTNTEPKNALIVKKEENNNDTQVIYF